ncbi:MAG: ubiquinol-cytochrome c reductase iron-sulfur subunit [Candidatus Eremiobacteraeota bacterium]|nr:ubiquinol-cytochrome c reductase iron-sulfur subunit [Candidatus Eremiobacteraeota bacterium]
MPHSSTNVAAQGGHFHSGDEPETPEEVSRRQFMVNATITLSGVIGLGLAIPIVGSLLPSGGSGKGVWSPLDPAEWKQLQASTERPIKLSFTMKSKDAYLPEETNSQYVWGIKADQAKMQKARPDLFGAGGKSIFANIKGIEPYNVVNLGFVMFSPICPHLGCRFNYDADQNKFLCPCHGSIYTLEGAKSSGPAPRGLDPLPMREQSGQAEVMWIRYQDSTPDHVLISYTS